MNRKQKVSNSNVWWKESKKKSNKQQLIINISALEVSAKQKRKIKTVINYRGRLQSRSSASTWGYVFASYYVNTQPTIRYKEGKHEMAKLEVEVLPHSWRECRMLLGFQIHGPFLHHQSQQGSAAWLYKINRYLINTFPICLKNVKVSILLFLCFQMFGYILCFSCDSHTLCHCLHASYCIYCYCSWSLWEAKNSQDSIKDLTWVILPLVMCSWACIGSLVFSSRFHMSMLPFSLPMKKTAGRDCDQQAAVHTCSEYGDRKIGPSWMSNRVTGLILTKFGQVDFGCC